MKIVLKRYAAPKGGLLRASTDIDYFTVEARCILTPEEEGIFSKNEKLRHVELMQYIGLIENPMGLRASELLKRVTWKRKRFIEILEAEAEARHACELLQSLINWTAREGQEEIIDLQEPVRAA